MSAQTCYEVTKDHLVIADSALGIHLDVDMTGTVKKEEKHENGALAFEGYYLEGLLHGPVRHYFSTGALAGESWYVQGKKWGKSLFYTPSGDLRAYLRYIDGLQHGLQEYFHDEGALKLLLVYDQGILVEAEEYTADGSLRRRINDAENIDQLL